MVWRVQSPRWAPLRTANGPSDPVAGSHGASTPLDDGAAGPASSRAEERLQRVARTLGDAADGAVGLVRDPALEVEVLRLAPGEVAEPDALDASADGRVDPRDVGRARLSVTTRGSQAASRRRGQARPGRRGPARATRSPRAAPARARAGRSAATAASRSESRGGRRQLLEQRRVVDGSPCPPPRRARGRARPRSTPRQGLGRAPALAAGTHGPARPGRRRRARLVAGAGRHRRGPGRRAVAALPPWASRPPVRGRLRAAPGPAAADDPPPPRSASRQVGRERQGLRDRRAHRRQSGRRPRVEQVQQDPGQLGRGSGRASGARA